jgi:hypothetical protein
VPTLPTAGAIAKHPVAINSGAPPHHYQIKPCTIAVFARKCCFDGTITESVKLFHALNHIQTTSETVDCGEQARICKDKHQQINV